MATKCFVYIATSLDGFIARENGALDWLPQGETNDGEDFGYLRFFELIDTLVMGSHSYEKVLSFGEWPCTDKKVVVLSSRNLSIPEDLEFNVEVLNLKPRDLVQHLSQQGSKHLYIDGGKTIQAFIREGLIDEMTITRVPILLGTGRPLFGPVDNDTICHHIETTAFTNGFVQSRYTIQRQNLK